MSNSHSLLIALLSLSLILLSCSAEQYADTLENDPDSISESLSSSSELIGAWDGACEVTEITEDAMSYQTRFEFTSSYGLYQTLAFYSDDDCVSENKYFSGLMTYGLKLGESTNSGGEFRIISIGNWNYQIDHAELASYASNINFCSISNWQPGVAKVGRGPYIYKLNTHKTRYVIGMPDIPQDVDFSDPYLSYLALADFRFGNLMGDNGDCYMFFDVETNKSPARYAIENDILDLDFATSNIIASALKLDGTYHRAE